MTYLMRRRKKRLQLLVQAAHKHKRCLTIVNLNPSRPAVQRIFRSVIQLHNQELICYSYSYDADYSEVEKVHSSRAVVTVVIPSLCMLVIMKRQA
ncbi:hypothetical protein EON65_52105 [archaeon]|nr:MAG: hypothetical protein EON65_52105 [archaeon]